MDGERSERVSVLAFSATKEIMISASSIPTQRPLKKAA